FRRPHGELPVPAGRCRKKSRSVRARARSRRIARIEKARTRKRAGAACRPLLTADAPAIHSRWRRGQGNIPPTMEITGEQVIPKPQRETWDAICNPAVLQV